MQPTDAIIAVTLNCNSRCVMCDIWKNDIKDELGPEDLRALPPSLKGINITGGEPFLREDLPEIIRVVKEACPKARVVISTNGFMPERIKRLMPEVVKIDPRAAVRVSIDGLEAAHERVRGIPGGFKKCMESVEILKSSGVKDLGIAITLMGGNIDELPEVYSLSKGLGVELSVTVATDSESFFGKGKSSLCPADTERMKKALRPVITGEYLSWSPRRVLRAWFEKGLIGYKEGRKRAVPCDAGKGFFYLDSAARVHACHIIPAYMGSLKEKGWEGVWRSPLADKVREGVKGCEKCWMVCTAKSEMRKNPLRTGFEIISDKVKTHLGLFQ